MVSDAKGALALESIGREINAPTTRQSIKGRKADFTRPPFAEVVRFRGSFMLTLLSSSGRKIMAAAAGHFSALQELPAAAILSSFNYWQLLVFV
jgi:hypothetical protein